MTTKKVNPILGNKNRIKIFDMYKIKHGFKTDSSIIALYPPKL